MTWWNEIELRSWEVDELLRQERENDRTLEVECPGCGGEGRIETEVGIDYRDGSIVTHGETCRYCGGARCEHVELRPIEMADLDEVAS